MNIYYVNIDITISWWIFWNKFAYSSSYARKKKQFWIDNRLTIQLILRWFSIENHMENEEKKQLNN